MKKIALGCGIVVLIAGIGVVAGGYYLYSRARTYVGQFTKVAELDKNIANTVPFTPPASGELTESMVQRFASVQEQMQTRLGPEVQKMKATQDEFERRQHEEHRDVSASEAFKAVSDLIKLVVDAKTAQVDALNAAKFSRDEYYWVRTQFYSAAGLRFTELNLHDMTNGGQLTKTFQAAEDAVPARNKKLVAPYQDKVKDWLVLGFFGM
ncbi:MAG TPA: hypothetical protein VFX12_10955 [Vicinamibacterales bacterium]|nr:hypothetical protein [Vicinamibacterales bacterium]